MRPLMFMFVLECLFTGLLLCICLHCRGREARAFALLSRSRVASRAACAHTHFTRERCFSSTCFSSSGAAAATHCCHSLTFSSLLVRQRSRSSVYSTRVFVYLCVCLYK